MLQLYSDGSLEDKSTQKYDEYGNQVEWCVNDSDGILIYQFTYKYEYDKNGNWIKSIEFINTIPYKIIEREIEYFK